MLWNDTNYGTQNWKFNSNNAYEDYEIKREELENILKKLENGKTSGEYNVHSELQKYASEKLETNFYVKFMYVGEE
jgi:exonuclease VII small subunit